MKEHNMEKYTRLYIKERKKKYSFENILDEVRREQILISLGKYKPHSVLEVGCGIEPLFKYYNNYEKYVIVEPSRIFSHIAESLAKNINKNIIIIEKKIEQAYKELAKLKPFDYIILSSLLHEVPSPIKVLKIIHKVCNKDTIVIINVPNANSFHRLLAFEANMIRSIFEPSKTDLMFNRYTRFDKQLLFKLLDYNGFAILNYWTYFIKPFSNEQMEKLLRLKIIDKKIIVGFKNMSKYLPDMGCEMFVEVKIK